MLLAIDIGNSTVSLGIIHNSRVITKHNLLTDKGLKAPALEKVIKHWLTDLKKVDGVIISSVVPRVDSVFKGVVKKVFKLNPVFVNSSINLGIKVKVRYPEQVGADRLVNASAGHHYFKGNLIVIDFGTATTFDYISKNGDFLGGVIAPGINISAEALFKGTSKLKGVKPSRVKKVIGKDTESAVKSGVYYGYIGLVEKIVSKMSTEINAKVKVIATGGAYSIIKNGLSLVDTYDEHLIFKGLEKIYTLNNSS
jgi:type III pantothenate kinase